MSRNLCAQSRNYFGYSQKESGRFDLPIAIGILAASGQIPSDKLAQYEFAGELALTGELRRIRGALAMTYKACEDGRAFILPKVSAEEAALVEAATVYPPHPCLKFARILQGRLRLQSIRGAPKSSPHLTLS